MTQHDTAPLALSRRDFLIGATLAGASLIIGVTPARAAPGAAPFAPNPFVRIAPDGKVTVVMASVEMGQGVYTSVAMLVAEELEVPLSKIVMEHAPADATRYANPILRDQLTGGSVAIRGVYEPMRLAGAAARVMLVGAAAKGWGVDPATCTAKAGQVFHPASGRKAAYGSLVAAAAAEPVPQKPPLKPASEFKLIGKPVRRLDAKAKVTGAAKFGIDARPKGLSYAAIALCPHFNGTLKSVDDSKAKAVKGVKQVVKTADSVAVVASNTGAARKGLAALAIAWNPGANGALTTADLEKQAEAALDKKGLPAVTVGDVAKAEAENGPVHAFVYRLPILAHSTMEPMSCTLDVRKDSCDVWLSSQAMARARQAVADTLGMAIDKVVLHNHYLGGGFGRRLDSDFAVAAAKIAKQVKGPVKVTWSREEDMRHDCFRYLNYSKVWATLDKDGMPLSWRHRVVGPAIMLRFLPAFTKDGVDLDIMGGAETPYGIPNKATEFVRNEAPDGLFTGNWRGVGATRNAPAMEGVIDELAHKAGIDPVEYRRRLLANHPRLLATLELAAQKAGWGKPLPAGKGRGIALMEDFGSWAAMISEVTVGADGGLKVDRIVCAVDCGQVINPDTVEAQIQSGIVYGLSATLYGRMTVANGAIVEGNFDDAPVLRIHEMPRIEVHVVPSKEPPGGIGEVGTPGVAPSVLNAIFMATGKRLRDLPIDQSQLRKA